MEQRKLSGKSFPTKRILKGWLGAELATAAWNTYAKRYRQADKEDMAQFTDEFFQLIDRTKENGFEIIYEVAWALVVMACHHHLICEEYCNRELTEQEVADQETIEEALRSVFAESAIKTSHQNDPRGRTLMLILPDGRHNSMDGETWRIPMP